MNSSIPYLVKKDDTLESIAKELGITDPYDLRHYHNMNAEINDGIGQEPVQGKTLLTPSPEKIKEINAKRAKLDEAEEAEIQKEEQVKEEQHKQQKEEKEQEEKQEKETVQNAHNDKYFVVHGGLCSCDKAENPKQTAKLLVTSHNKVILNAEAGKFFATEIDKTFDPAAATFGKCTLKPSSGGNQPCALAPAPKWTKVYDKTSIFGNKVLTEISTLRCTVGGKIEVAKHGQTNTVMKEHAEKTNPAALALINPAVKMPNLKTAYPSVSSIALKSLKNDPDFKAVSSAQTKNVEKIVIRPNQECTFEAKVSKGNVDFVSWVIYEGFDGDKDKRLYTEEQIGTRFTYTFSTVGKYRIEGYGKPKQDDPEAETAYKSYPDCCLDIEVILNKLQGTELLPIDGGNFTKMIGGKMRLRQNFPASFKANFLMPPTDEELENLKMYVTDASGSVLKSTRIENTISFTPVNTKAKYTITAQYKLSAEEVQKQSFSAETITNSVSQITHNAEVIRPGTPMNFAVKESTFSLYIPDEQEAVAKEVQAVKWNLNGRLIGNGKSITIPGHELMNFGKYVIEAYVTLANAYGQNAKHEEDDWHFEVKENDVISFSYTGVPKVGKTTFLEADHLVFPDLTVNETVIWDTAIPHKTTDKKTISIKPLKAGKEIVKCRINRQQGKTLSIDVKQAKVLGMMFTDSNGIEIEKSGWHQTVNIWVQQEHLIGEDLTIEIWDNDAFKDDYCKAINIKSYDGNLIPFTLDSYVKSKAGDWAMLYVKISAPKLKLANTEGVFKSKNRLDVQDKREIYSAQIGSQDAKQRHYHVDYNQLSYFYGKSRGIKAGEKLKITIYEKGKKLFEVTDATVDTSGAVKGKLQWDRISEKLPSRTVYAVVQDGEDKILYNGNKTANGGVAITKKSALLGLAEYKSAVLVKKSESSISKMNNKNCACECEARVRAFMSMLRVKEGTTGEVGYKKLFGHRDFTKAPYNKDFSTHPQIYIPYGDTSTSAAGAYQIMYDTFKGLNGYYKDTNGVWHYVEKNNRAKLYNINTFNQESQDKYCVTILKYSYVSERKESFFWKTDSRGVKTEISQRRKFRGLKGDIVQLIIDDNLEKAALLSSLCWSSLPNAPYGQQDPNYTFADVKDIYNDFLKKELAEKSDLYLKKGFLKEFGYECCAVNDKTNCPDDCSQCFNYADVWDNPEISSDNHGKNNNRYGTSTRGHKGVDILSGPNYKDVHSLLCGTVENIVTSFRTNEYGFLKLGNVVNIKSKDKDGKTVYILYCHLDSVSVRIGQKVKHGQKIAVSGSTGNASYDGLPNGSAGHGIKKEFWHCHIEACSDGANAVTFFGKDRLNPEDYMKTKFDKDGNRIEK
jgi:murein DD-endopeptidase MepM/ murein hydrolase activator NlpD